VHNTKIVTLNYITPETRTEVKLTLFRRSKGLRELLVEIVQKFRQKGAFSPETAMTAEELGLPPRFEETMQRRLGRSGIFVEVDGKYYLSEERLKQIQEQLVKAGYGSRGDSNWSRADLPTWFRVLVIWLMLPIGIIIALVLFYFVASGGGFFPGEMLIGLVVICLGLAVARLFFWRLRRRDWRSAQDVGLIAMA
jgi:hypothetical protein